MLPSSHRGPTNNMLRVGGSIEHYLIGGELGKGAFGVVYQARDARDDSIVAIKVLDPDPALDYAEAYQRFLREAEALAMLRHENIVAVKESGEWQGYLWMAMEFISGKTIKDLMHLNALFPLSRTIDIGFQILSGLSACHQKNIIHRDIKPANIILLPEDAVKIIDFGIVRFSAVPGITIQGKILGTPHYMSPEQVHGEAVDGRSDLFSAAVVLYEMLTGYKPFTVAGDTPEAIYATLNNICSTKHAPPSSYNADLNTSVDLFFEKALAKDPSQRFQTAREFQQALVGLSIEPPVAASIDADALNRAAADAIKSLRRVHTAYSPPPKPFPSPRAPSPPPPDLLSYHIRDYTPAEKIWWAINDAVTWVREISPSPLLVAIAMIGTVICFLVWVTGQQGQPSSSTSATVTSSSAVAPLEIGLRLHSVQRAYYSDKPYRKGFIATFDVADQHLTESSDVYRRRLSDRLEIAIIPGFERMQATSLVPEVWKVCWGYFVVIIDQGATCVTKFKVNEDGQLAALEFSDYGPFFEDLLGIPFPSSGLEEKAKSGTLGTARFADGKKEWSGNSAVLTDRRSRSRIYIDFNLLSMDTDSINYGNGDQAYFRCPKGTLTISVE